MSRGPALLLLPLVLAVGRSYAGGPSVAVPRATGIVAVDGMLDDPAWAGASVIEDLTQKDPHPGEATPFRTQVLLLVDERNLYFGFRCFDPEPDRIAVHTLARDGDQTGDDHVTIALDTFNDQRTGYIFRVNAEGARQDGLIYGPESESADWDGIWEGRAVRTPDGWTAEIVLPARTLHFTPGAPSWGFNVARYVPRSRLTLQWSGLTLDAFFNDMRRAGALSGLESLQQGLGLTLSPYGLVRYEWRRFEGGATQGDAGLDVTYNPTPSVTGVLTLNTDFAETDADAQQINLTRFPLFFPEKRAFFLEGANTFSFGTGIEETFIPFFSRRVGLFEDRRVPILAGIKVLGRAGPWGLGVLDAYTDSLPPESGAPGVERENLAAGRLTYDATSHLRLGGIFTDGDPSGATDNTLGGADALWQTSSLFGSRNFSVGGWYARSFGDLARGSPDGYGFKVDYPNDLWDIAVVFSQFGVALDPRLGFLPRAGTRQYTTYVAWQPRPGPGAFDWVRQFFFEIEPSVVETTDGVTESWRLFTAPFNVRTQTGEHLEANWAPQFERLFAPFEISKGIVIPAGDYHFTRYRVEAQSSEHRPWTVGATVWFGEFFGGRLTQSVAFAGYTSPAGRQHIEVTSENDYGSLPQGSFIERLHQLRWTTAFSPDLALSLFAQQQVGSGALGWNARLRWTVKPGNDLFVVWNRNWIEIAPAGGGSERLEHESDQVIVKARWSFR